jgi:hypothetical protein
MKLRADSVHADLFVAYDDNGDVAAQGYLDVDPDGVVRFVNILTPEQLEE